LAEADASLGFVGAGAVYEAEVGKVSGISCLDVTVVWDAL